MQWERVKIESCDGPRVTQAGRWLNPPAGREFANLRERVGVRDCGVDLPLVVLVSLDLD